MGLINEGSTAVHTKNTPSRIHSKLWESVVCIQMLVYTCSFLFPWCTSISLLCDPAQCLKHIVSAAVNIIKVHCTKVPLRMHIDQTKFSHKVQTHVICHEALLSYFFNLKQQSKTLPGSESKATNYQLWHNFILSREPHLHFKPCVYALCRSNASMHSGWYMLH